MYTNIVFAIVAFCAFGVQAWNVHQLTDTECLRQPPRTSEHLDFNWLLSVDRLYFTHGSKLAIYRTAAELLNVPVTSVNDADLYYQSCITLRLVNETLAEVEGFHGHGRSLSTFTPHHDGRLTWTLTNTGISGTTTVPLTDGETYAFFYTCWEDGHSTWAVTSTTPSLNPATVDEIHAYARYLGFNREHFTRVEFDHCNSV